MAIDSFPFHAALSITCCCSGNEPALLPSGRKDRTRESGGNRAYFVSRSGDSFCPLFFSGAQAKGPESNEWVLLVVHGQYMPYPAPPLSPYLLTDRASPTCLLTSSFVIVIGQYILNILRRHLCRNVSSFASSLRLGHFPSLASVK